MPTHAQLSKIVTRKQKSEHKSDPTDLNLLNVDEYEVIYAANILLGDLSQNSKMVNKFSVKIIVLSHPTSDLQEQTRVDHIQFIARRSQRQRHSHSR